MISRLLCIAAIAGTAMSASADPLSIGQRIAESFLHGEFETIWERSTPKMREAFGSVEEIAAIRHQLRSQFGAEAAVLSEQVETRSGYDVFTRLARWDGGDTPLRIEIALDAADRIAGFVVRPQRVAAESPHLDYRTRAALRLPVQGAWAVVWGGREIELNYHAADPVQRFAVDLLALEDGLSHSGDPGDLASYHCWGRPILSPGAGEVVTAIGDLPDQRIGRRDPDNPAGNHVVIDLGTGEYGVLAHLQQGSLRVSKGDRVAQGQVIGACGNSGNSTEPHLHFHLQTSASFGEGLGLPAQFQDYLANGAPVARGEPVRGETVRPAGG